jgi:hypothetical protein
MAGAKLAWRPPTSLTPWKWAEKNVTLQNSSRSSKFRVSETPWLMGPMECASDPEIFVVCLLAPTGSGKSTMAEALISYIVCEDPGPLMYASQNDKDASFWAETRLVPTLKKCPAMDGLWSDDRNKTRKTEIILPHMPIVVEGANISNFQEKSCRWLYGDEVWKWAAGLIREFKARDHNRWNRKMYLVAQGGFVDSEWDGEWKKTDMADFSWLCQSCKTPQIYSWDSLRYDTIKREDGTIDEQSTSETARIECIYCREQYADTSIQRRKLAMSNIGNGNKGYIPRDNPEALTGYRGFHVDSLALFDVPWSQEVLGFLEAQRLLKQGLTDKLRQWKQKRRAQFWSDDMADTKVSLSRSSDYSKLDCENGAPIENESARFMTADVGGDHFWIVVQAWKQGGASKILYEGFVPSDGKDEDELCRMREKYNVPPRQVLIDIGYEQDRIFDLCAKHDWTGVKGEGQKRSFPHRRKDGKIIEKLYSKNQYARSKSGPIVRYVFLATNPIKDIAHRILIGEAAEIELPSDLSKTFENHTQAERREMAKSQKTGQEYSVWVTKNRKNHLWDCLVYQVGAALIFGIFKDSDDA